MPFIPHTAKDIKDMLETININDIDALFDEIPPALRFSNLTNIPEGVTELALTQEMEKRAAKDAGFACYIGAGAYEHHIPAAVFDTAMRGEFYTAYTPYQPEASQGSLQLIYEYQTMMANLMGMEVSNASLYDGASSLAEAILMAVRLAKHQQRKILLPRTIHPYYRDTVKAIVSQQNINLIEVPYLKATGQIDATKLDQLMDEEVAALVIPQPNFFGILEDVDGLTHWAKEKKILSIAVVNPLSMALLKPPGQWGDDGVDIACGEGQPLGIPLASGGPYYGFMCSKKQHVRQMPGRIVGRTTDVEGKSGFVLTLQAREQHIRRGKATSNICTNQGLMVTASTIYMSLMGPQGLKHTALRCHERARQLKQQLSQMTNCHIVFKGAFFHELVIALNKPVDLVLQKLAAENIQGGFSLTQEYPEIPNGLLICVTETKTLNDINEYAKKLSSVLAG